MWLLNELNASEVRQKDLCGVVINYRITMTSMQLPLIQRVYPNLYLTLWPCTKSSTVALNCYQAPCTASDRKLGGSYLSKAG